MRAPKERTIQTLPEATHYKPVGVPLKRLQSVRLQLDQLEAMRLVDVEGMNQEQAAQSMGVSKPTVCRMLREGRRAVALALVSGAAISIEGGNFRLQNDESPRHGRRHGHGGGRGGPQHGP